MNIADGLPCLQVNPKPAELAPEARRKRHVLGKAALADNQRVRRAAAGLQQTADILRVVLAVRVHGDEVRISFLRGPAGGVQNHGAFAAVFLKAFKKYGQPFQLFFGRGCTAVVKHGHRQPLGQTSLRHRAQRAVVVVMRDDDDVLHLIFTVPSFHARKNGRVNSGHSSKSRCSLSINNCTLYARVITRPDSSKIVKS